ncbi:hypothetical protein FB379_105171 [Aeribacillus composti]|uniref:hypothetical protein n=1 Tax=Aeribacillus composti TaxID=1868734 RepID=UPI00119A2405|nr:hypothetical protein [Aeribacillus composti]TVZ86181.1 hypothetical protein FB379_105171 [Aeribacillus composti]
MESSLLLKELRTKEEIFEGFSVMKHLRIQSFLELVLEAKQKEGYQLVALYDHNKMVAITGFMPMITLYYCKLSFYLRIKSLLFCKFLRDVLLPFSERVC